jgi:hypothetical protein
VPTVAMKAVNIILRVMCQDQCFAMEIMAEFMVLSRCEELVLELDMRDSNERAGP